MVSPFVAFDCETSGLDPSGDGILQIAAARIEDGDVAAEFDSLVRFDGRLSVSVARLTGLRPEDLRQASEPAEVLAGFCAFAGDLPLVAHNAPFDLAFLQAGLQRCRLPARGGPAYDTFTLARLVQPHAASFRLAELAAGYDLPLPRAHDARHDARAAGLLFWRLQAELAAMAPPLLATLEFLLRPVADATWSLVAAALAERGGGAVQPLLAGGRGGRRIRARGAAGPADRPPPPAGDPRPDGGTGQGGADGASPTQGGAPGVGDMDPAAAELAAAGQPALLDGAFDPGALAAALEPGGVVARAWPGFEPRPGQTAMLRAVAGAFRDERHLLVEAGTGTGKSLAYLLPALAWARAHQERVVVATHTVNLQEQLIGKDIPLLAQAAGTAIRAALLKGRGHYLCLKSWSEALTDAPEPAEAHFRARVAAWLAATDSGDRGELDLFGEDEERWYALSTDAVACTGRHCPWFDRCFLFRARARAEAAEVVVVNHALLLSDLRVGKRALPEYRRLVVDEAHHLDEQAAYHLGATLSERRCLEFLSGLDRGRGLLAALRRRGQGAADLFAAAPRGEGPAAAEAAAGEGGSAGPDLSGRLQRLSAQAAEAHAVAVDVFQRLREFARARAGERAARQVTARLEPRRDEPAWEACTAAGSALALHLQDLRRALDGLAHELGQGPLGDGDALAAEAGQAAARAGEYAAALQLFLEGRDGWVTWAETLLRRGGAGPVTLRGAPIEPGPLLAAQLFGPSASVVLTSATLSVADSFRYLAGRLGLDADPDRYDARAVASPFDFRDQALLIVADDLPDPRQQGPFLAALGPFLTRLLTASGGRGLVLFTSNRALRATYGALKPALEPEGIAVLGQGLDGSRGRLAAALREGGATVVLGASSFWEGIDVPGEALSCVVLTQLPFWAPDIPLVQARGEAVAAAGGSPFRDLALPQAALRFKQGFGRLIRSAGDRGVAVVCDRRLAKLDYGQVILHSLPGPRLFVGPQEQVLQRAERFLSG